MPKWTKRTQSAPGVTVGGKTPPIPVGGRDAPGHGFDPKKIVQAQTAALMKDATVQGDNNSPGLSPGLVGAGFAWHKLPQQKPLSEKRAVPKLITGPYRVCPSASCAAPDKAQQGGGPANLAKDSADTEPTTEYDNSGRPQWMSSPGYGGKAPEYRSQKPGANGNTDELFSENINDKPPKVIPVDPDAYYIW
jgi:hypothetical protein